MHMLTKVIGKLRRDETIITCWRIDILSAVFRSCLRRPENIVDERITIIEKIWIFVCFFLKVFGLECEYLEGINL